MTSPANDHLNIDITLQRDQFRLQMKFTALAGSVIALFGPSGCGKTTTANLIAGLLIPDSGRMTIGNRVLFDSATRVNVPAEQRHIGYVFQDARLFPHMSVARNLNYGLQRTRNQPFVEMDFVIKLLDDEEIGRAHV